jgi:hypothetical protein
MAKIQKLAKPAGKGAPPKPAEAVSNLDKPDRNGLANLNLRVPREFKRELKQFALDQEQTITSLLMDGIRLLKQQRG